MCILDVICKNQQGISILTNTIAVIGGGVIGRLTAWRLAKEGYEVLLTDPLIGKIDQGQSRGNGTNASLGVLMGYVYRRNSGRAWKLRLQSMALWHKWIKELTNKKLQVKIKTPLIQLARSDKEAFLMQEIAKQRKNYKVEFKSEIKKSYNNHFIKNDFGGLISYNDGIINPLDLQNCLYKKLKEENIKILTEAVSYIKKDTSLNNHSWSIKFMTGELILVNKVVLCCALGSNKIIKQLGYEDIIEPVLGQALEIELKSKNETWKNWPAVLIHHGINLIPNGTGKLILGATLEPGQYSSMMKLIELKLLNGFAPNWIKESKVLREWKGIRAKPINQPAPILKKLEKGLFIATGHYRNGLLLAPATAEWVVDQIRNDYN